MLYNTTKKIGLHTNTHKGIDIKSGNQIEIKAITKFNGSNSNF